MTEMIALAAPGLGQLVLEEQALLGVAPTAGKVTPLRNHDYVTFTCQGDPRKALNARLAEDLFVVLGAGFPAAKKTDLKRTIPRGLRDKILKYLPLRETRRKQKKTTNVAVFVKQDREYELFRRTLAAPLLDFLTTQFQHWVVREPADIELWYFVVNGVGSLGLRLTTGEFRKRSYRAADRPGSLRPTIAAALVVASKPGPFDYFLDPMCGSGTIALERALAAPANAIHGSDIDEEAIALAQESARRAKVSVDFRKIDARSAELQQLHASKVTHLVSNLPFGRQFGSDEDLRALYCAALENWKSLLSSDGSMTLLVQSPGILKEAARTAGLRSALIESWKIKGIRAAAMRVWR